VYKNLVRKSEGKRPLGRPRSKWEDNNKMVLREIGRGLNSCHSGWRPMASSCEQGNEPSGSIKGREFLV
jgi:hypothetical protein